MPKVTTQFTMSLDGFIADENDGVGRLLGWYRSGDTPYPVLGTDMVFKISQVSAALLQEEWGMIGAIVTGRRDFDVSEAWGGQPPFSVPTFIVTHRVPQEWAAEGSPFTFVTEGVASAVARAREAAGAKNVAVSGTQVVQQCLETGLLDEIQIDLVPLLLGKGIRLFGSLDSEPITLQNMGVIEGVGVTHLKFRVMK